MGASPRFPPLQIVLVIALACELPTQRREPLSRSSTADLARLISAHPDAPPLSPSSIWRLLDRHALKPWQQQCWIFPRDGQFGRLVDQVMQQAPFRSARRVVWIVDNGSSHRGAKAARELQARYPNLILVHLPTHASWLNQIEVYFSIIQRKVLTPNDFPDLAAVEARLLAFATLYNDTARPFDWRFTRATLEERLAHLTPVPLTGPATAEPALQQVA